MSINRVQQENTPLLSPGSPTFLSPPHYEAHNNQGSITIVVLTVFFQSIGFTVTLPSMAYYLTSLGVSEQFYGWIVAIYSAGQFVGSPIFGYWSNHAPSRLVIVVSLFISAIGNTLYGFVAIIPHHAGWVMFVSRFLVGVGAGNVSVCRAYASEASSLENRASTMAKLSMAQGMGFVVGPIIGFIMDFCDFHVGSVPVNKYTSPGFVSAIFGIANTIFAAILFKELPSRKVLPKRQASMDKPSKQELVPICISIFLFFVVISVFSIFETMIPIVTKNDFNWKVGDNGIFFIAVGALSVVVFAIINTPYMKMRDDRKMMVFGTVLQIIGLATAATWVWPFRLESKLPKTQFFIASAFLSVGYPISSAYMFAIYSKVLDPNFQGTKMGWLTAGGSIARMIGPIWATHAFAFSGELLFLGTDVLVIISLAVLIASYRRLAPHPSYFAGYSPPLSVNTERQKLMTGA